jgi:hypothetical protein
MIREMHRFVVRDAFASCFRRTQAGSVLALNGGIPMEDARMATGSIVAAPRPQHDPTINQRKTTWRRFGTPLLVVTHAS